MKKTEVLNIKISPKELAAIKQRALELGLTVSAYMRMIAIKEIAESKK